MRHWLILAVLVSFFCGCKSVSHSDKEKPVKADQDIRANIPSGEAPPFGPPP